MIPRTLIGASAAAAAIALNAAHAATSTIITFEDFSLPTTGAEAGYWNGSAMNGTPSPGSWGSTNYDQDLVFQGAKFHNTYSNGGYWSGFAISSLYDVTTAGYGNQYSVFASGGADGSSQFAVSYGPTYTGATNSIFFSALTNMAGAGASFANTTYAALAMKNGEGSATAFQLGDWFKLTIEGFAGATPTGSTELYLADFRTASSGGILSDWKFVDFTSLGSVDQLRFSLTSSDNDPVWGMNTPSYFAIDNFVIPEPSSLVIAMVSGFGFILRRRR